MVAGRCLRSRTLDRHGTITERGAAGPKAEKRALPLRARFAWLRAGLLPGKRAAEALLEFGDEGRRAERPPRAFVGADGFAFLLRQRFLKEGAPVAHVLEQRLDVNDPIVAAGKMRPRTGPLPIARTLRDLSQHRRQFHEFCAGENMAVVHRERCKSSLPEKTPPVLAVVDRARVAAMGLSKRRAQPV